MLGGVSGLLTFLGLVLAVHGLVSGSPKSSEDREIELLEKKVALLKDYLSQKGQNGASETGFSFETIFQEHLQQAKKGSSGEASRPESTGKVSIATYPIFESRAEIFANITHFEVAVVKQYQTLQYRRPAA